MWVLRVPYAVELLPEWSWLALEQGKEGAGCFRPEDLSFGLRKPLLEFRRTFSQGLFKMVGFVVCSAKWTKLIVESP